jgi:hypothetical protein
MQERACCSGTPRCRPARLHQAGVAGFLRALRDGGAVARTAAIAVPDAARTNHDHADAASGL